MLDFDSHEALPSDAVVPDAAVPVEARAGRPARQLLPDDLEESDPGPSLLAVLSSVDPKRLNGYDAVRYTQAAARMESHCAAMRLAGIAEVAYSPSSGPDDDATRNRREIEYASWEVAAALT